MNTRSSGKKLISACCILLTFFCTSAISATISINNGDSAGEGFNDPTAVAPVTGNNGTTLGRQRLNVFKAAADYWGNYLSSPVTIVVEASMDPLQCDSSQAVLGSAGPTTGHKDFTNAPRAATWYPSALANSLAGSDLNGATAEISAQFNSDIDNNNNCLNNHNWWYGIGGSTPSNTTSLYDTVLHEIGHGLGFLTFVQSDGSKFNGSDDHFMQFLQNNSTGKKWPDMTNGERYASSRNNNLVWTGTNVVNNSGFLQAGKTAQGKVKLFAPNPYQSGSSVSHWDTSLDPDELMEPYATLTSNDTLTKMAFKDMGWKAAGVQPPTPTPGDGKGSLIPVFSLLLGGSQYPELPINVQIPGTVQLKKWQYYKIELNTGDQLTVDLFNLTADLDLFLREASLPTATPGEYDCHSEQLGTSAEQCIIGPVSSSSTWYIGVYGYAAGDYIIRAQK